MDIITCVRKYINFRLLQINNKLTFCINLFVFQKSFIKINLLQTKACRYSNIYKFVSIIMHKYTPSIALCFLHLKTTYQWIYNLLFYSPSFTMSYLCRLDNDITIRDCIIG